MRQMKVVPLVVYAAEAENDSVSTYLTASDFDCESSFSTDSKQHFHLLHLRSEPLFTFYRLCLTIFVCRRNFEAFYYHGSAPTRGSPGRGHRDQMPHNDSKQPKTSGGKFQEWLRYYSRR